jgi:glycosyltransferase involved in cell wall biosynthesis
MGRGNGGLGAKRDDGSGGDREFLITSYMLGAPDGRNLGAPGYSHEFVARLFRPLLSRWGRVVDIRDPRRQLAAAVADCRRRGATPIHFSVLPFQDVCLADGAINIVMPAWEFPDVPDHPFDGNPQNDWPATANRADLVLVSGPFTADALSRAGTTTPVRIVPVPTPDDYFALPPWQPEGSHSIGCRAYVFQSDDMAESSHDPARSRWVKRGERRVRDLVRTVLGPTIYPRVSRSLRSWRHWRRHAARPSTLADLPYPRVDQLELSGVVYTSIFNPDDGRKNWEDLLSAALVALGDHDDATLVVKLITRSHKSVRTVIDHYLSRGIPHRCRVVFIAEFLSHEQLHRLCEATTYYLQATRAEGNCLPLMNHLAAGRPGISPGHSSMGDYFDHRDGFVVESHPEPAAWPHDRRLRLRTTWGRIVWTSLRDQIDASYRLVRDRPAEYAGLARRCRWRMARWASEKAVAGRLAAALHEFGLADHRPMADAEPAGPWKAAA